ncbi:MAG: hypothetical protein OEY49_00790 [Candidatus Heimdallarchaeota archaeon]|nr:hypothetical protein [Candidatus Heimdallarchaeota archaeon]
MSSDPIKFVLETGKCPTCDNLIISNEDMTSYHCENSRDHFDLKVTFHGGEKMTATLNGNDVPENELAEIDW